MPPVVAQDQRQLHQTHQIAKRELVRQVEQGMTAWEAQRRCPVPIHRTTVYRLLKRVEREGEQALAERRHGHPIKLRGEVLTFLLDFCYFQRRSPTPAGRTICALGQCESAQSGTGRTRSESPARAIDPARKKSRKLASLLPQDIMSKRVDCCCWLQPLKPTCSLT